MSIIMLTLIAYADLTGGVVYVLGINIILPTVFLMFEISNKEAIWLYAELFLGISKYIMYLIEIILDYLAVVPSSALISPIFFEDN